MSSQDAAQPPRDESIETLRAAAETADGQSFVPGRELDALVAECVMGYEWRVINRRRKELRSPVGTVVAYVEGKETHYTGYRTPNLPEFSTDIAAAMEVVEKLQSEGHDIQLLYAADVKEWYAAILIVGSGRNVAHASRASLPEAICRAALAAVVHNEEK